jgi:hypothetical protein
MVGDLMGDDQMVLGLGHGLHIVADGAGQAVAVTISRVSGSVSDTCLSSEASIAASSAFSFCICALSRVSLSRSLPEPELSPLMLSWRSAASSASDIEPYSLPAWPGAS